MSIQRIFLDWRSPLLTQAADWLLAQSTRAQNPLDLGQATLVVPGSRAGRRLLEILVERSAGQALSPPRIVTISGLPEALHQPGKPVIDELTSRLFRAQAIARMSREQLQPLLRHPPKQEDVIGLLSLAGEIQQIADELAGHLLSFEQVAGRCASLVDYDDQLRWQVLADIQQRYEAMLDEQGVLDVSIARRQALDAGLLSHDGAVVVIAASDLPPLHHEMLRRLASPVHALVHAPASLAQGFDDVGQPITAVWESRPLTLEPERVHVMARPQDQGYEVARIIAGFRPLPPADQVTVGLGDPQLGPLIGRVLQATGIPTRLATGRSLLQSPPVVLLEQLASLMTRQTTRELALALRCPAIEERVRLALGDQGQLLLTRLDQYIDKHLPQPLAAGWLGKPEEHQLIARAQEALLSFLPEDWSQSKPLPDWPHAIATMLAGFFGQRPLDRFHEEDAQLIRALQAIADALQTQENIPPSLPLAQRFTLPQAITLLLMQLAGQWLAPEAGEPAVELLGWLELQHDDAPHLVITGFNEGQVPQNVNHHWLLPDTLRQQLGLADNRKRLARDAYMLAAIGHSRPQAHVVLGRTTARGDVLAPSRLLLMGDAASLPAWIERFYDDAHAPAGAPLLITPGKASTFQVPRPRPLDQPVTSLTVTAFRQYIACPYRFYLRHVLQLEPLSDQAIEMDARAFGNMAHAVLDAFASSPAVHSVDHREIEDWLADCLHDKVRSQYGRQPPAVIHIQREVLRQRLSGFARWQASSNDEGWRIDPKGAEKDLSADLVVDGASFIIRGRIDRIDHHPSQGHRLLDYKTGDSQQPPDRAHLDGQEQWLDLQLPLYHELARQNRLQGEIGLGYVLLPKDPRQAGLAMAERAASLVNEALDKARQIIRDIREEKFWPPSSAMHEDEFTAICMERSLSRGQPSHVADADAQAGGGRS